MKLLTLLALAGTLAAASANASNSPTRYAGHELAGKAKITLTQARAAALKARPGKIVEQELEKESGGSGLGYSFDVRSHGKTFEVGVDAQSGRVLENGSESPAKEAKEAAQEHARH